MAVSARPHAPRLFGTVATALLMLGVVACGAEESPVTATTAPEPAATAPAPAEPDLESFDRAAHSIDDPASVWVVSNKLRPLQPIDFEPSDLVMPTGIDNEFAQPLREPAARAAEAMLGDASAAGLPVRIISAYRDYATQVALYDGYVARDGQAAADTYSARPGHSEHQTGLVIDVDDYGDCYLAACFADTPTGTWIAEHAAEYGFIVRYPAEKDSVTGFTPEPWHLRYVGTELAAEMQRIGVTTLEEFFGLAPAAAYAS